MTAFPRLAFGAALLTVLTACGGGDSLSTGPRFLSYDGPPVTLVQVDKSDRVMHLISGQTVLKSYDVDLGNEPAGPKRIEGDGRTPEGTYVIDRFNPRSAYHLSVGISYPSPQDTLNAALLGAEPGGDIFIHGKGAEGRRLDKADWTAGCIAVEDAEIEEIYAMLTPGVPILIMP